MDYITPMEAAQKWGVSLRQVQRILAGNKIPNSKKCGRFWLIPADTEKPIDLRKTGKKLSYVQSSDLAYVIYGTTCLWPYDDPYAILDIVKEERLRKQYESELAYLRGDYKQAMQCFFSAGKDDATKLRAAPAAIAAAISMGDHRAYTEITAYLEKITDKFKDSIMSTMAELALATAAVSATAPDMAPGWLKYGDFHALPRQLRINACYLRAKYFQCLRQYDSMLAVAQTALAFGKTQQGITAFEIYLRLICACACYALNRLSEAKQYLLDTMRITLPHGFTTPFAELVTALGGLVEQCLKEEFPQYFDTVIEQWKRVIKNWITFHNRFTKENITTILSLREYHVALLAVNRVPYAAIAKQHGISVGRVKNIMQGVYNKLLISGRKELSEYIY